jgi:hypothetical protein
MLGKRKPEISFGFLLATIFWIGVLGWQASYGPTEIEKQECQNAAKKGGHKTEECKSLWERTTSDPVAFFTFWLVVSTVGLGGSTVLLWRVTRRSADIAERALTDLERAYIYIDKIGGELDPFVTMVDESNTPTFIVPEFSISLVNYGRTAGCIDLGIIRFEILKEMPPELLATDVRAERPNAQSIEIIIGPDKTYTFDHLGFESPFTHAQGMEMRAGTMNIYCHGYFSYSDIFNRSHPIKFCRKYVHNHREWESEGGRQRNAA